MKIDSFAFIIGSMKCGTTYLFNYLAQHPDIAPCEPKEPEFFTVNYDKGFDWYESLFSFEPARHKIALEGSTGYTRYPDWYPNPAERIQAANLKAKFIYVVRDPIERVESNYNFGVLHDWGRDRDILDYRAVHCSMYAMQLDEYMKRFAQEDILILRFDDIKANMPKVANQVFQFLGLRQLDLQEAKEVVTAGRNHTAEQTAEYNFYYNLKQALPIKGLYQKVVPHQMRVSFNRLFRRKLTRDVQRRMTSAEKQQLAQLLQDDLARLQRHYQIDISPWSIASML
ncbi:MAG: sulfotransferase [Cyanobacteria bacterium P01_C01_bin.73]